MSKKAASKIKAGLDEALSIAKTPTLITFILDKSGSMGIIRGSTIEAFNAYVDAMRDASNIELTLVQFDTPSGWGGLCLDKTFVGVPVASVPKLSEENYIPRGNTPLIDAAYTVIKAIETQLLEKPKDTKVVVCIQTDGHENASLEHNWEELNVLIKEKQKAGWQFNFMGAGIDAYKQATMMGIGAASTMSYDEQDFRATMSAYTARGVASALFASGKLSNMEISSLEKMAAGDKFDPSVAESPAKSILAKVKEEFRL